MTAQQLKNSILQMAVQGKLVPQDPNDEPASVLLERIRAEKEKLIKEGKIKKEKNPSVIFRGEDGLPYEKVGKNEPVCIADEVPFEIPESWEWVRLGNIVFNHGQKKPDSDFSYIDIGSIDNSNQTLNSNETIISAEKVPSRARKIVFQGDILYSTVRPYLHNMCIVNKGFSHEPIASTGFAVLSCYADLYNSYLFYYMMSPAFDSYANDTENSKGVAYPAINDERLYRALIPVPPVTEQHRIIDKYLSIDPQVKQYNAIEVTLSALNKDFPELLKKSILQQAVMGKLVPQDESDEPASVLLDRIRAEKQSLIKAGKLKKDKHESIIYRRDNSHYEKLDGVERCIDDEIPFKIPENWAWCRLSSLGEIVGGGTPKTEEAEYWSGGTIAWLTPADMKYVLGKYVSHGERFITNAGLQGSSAQLMPEGTVVYSSRAPIGYIAISQNELCTNQGFKSLVPAIVDVNQYIYYCLIERTPEIQSRASGTTFKEISGAEFGRTLVPLPPMNEQKRIVSEIEKILPLCRKL